MLGRDEEALSVLEAVRPDGPQGGKFTDLDMWGSAWWDYYSSAFADLGRYDDAIAAMRQGAAVQENGTPNVSQKLDLAELQMTHGHYADALTTLASFDAKPDTVSPFGMMVFIYNRGCARFRTGDLAGAKIDHDYAVAHERDLPANLEDMLLCMGDIDGAATEMIHRLDDPDLRVDALLALSDFDTPAYPNLSDPADANRGKLKLRADVRAAIERAGGTRTFNIQPGGY